MNLNKILEEGMLKKKERKRKKLIFDHYFLTTIFWWNLIKFLGFEKARPHHMARAEIFPK